VFVTFEGIDGSGKSTQARRLVELLRDGGREVVFTREPGGTPLGEEIRELVLHGDHMTAWAEAALYAASRAQHVEEVIRPALERGATVVCDRYLDSSVAYQGGGRGLGVDAVRDLNVAVVDGLLPDLTILLLVDPAAALGRVSDAPDRIEREDPGFHARVDVAYRELAAREPERFVVVDGALGVDELAEEVERALRIRS
jgi:dTMP kinase